MMAIVLLFAFLVVAIDIAFGATATTLDVSWTAPTTNTDGSPLTDLAGYRLYLAQGTASPCPTTLFSTITPITAVTATGLTPQTLYTAQVTAVNSQGLESACSNSASASTLAATGGPDNALALALVFAPSASTVTTTVTFDPNPPNIPTGSLDGTYGGIAWGTGQWNWGGPFGPATSNWATFSNNTSTSRTLTFSPAPRTLQSLRAFTQAPGTLTLTDNLGQNKVQVLTVGSMQLVITGWTQASTTITVLFTAGQNLGIDDVVYTNP